MGRPHPAEDLLAAPADRVRCKRRGVIGTRRPVATHRLEVPHEGDRAGMTKRGVPRSPGSGSETTVKDGAASASGGPIGNFRACPLSEFGQDVQREVQLVLGVVRVGTQPEH